MPVNDLKIDEVVDNIIKEKDDKFVKSLSGKLKFMNGKEMTFQAESNTEFEERVMKFNIMSNSFSSLQVLSSIAILVCIKKYPANAKYVRLILFIHIIVICDLTANQFSMEFICHDVELLHCCFLSQYDNFIFVIYLIF